MDKRLPAFLGFFLFIAATFIFCNIAWAETVSHVPCENALDGARYRGTATKITAGPHCGKVLLAGGDSESASVPTNASAIYTSCFLYNPDTNSFSQVSSLNIARTLHSAVALPDGRILVAGGFNGSNELSSAEIYDPINDTWTLAAYLNVARSHFSLHTLFNGAVLAAGGLNNGSALTSCELYDLNADNWGITSPLATARYDHAAILMQDGRLLVAGGNKSSTSTNNTFQIYTVPTETITAAWTPPGTLPFTFDSYYQCNSGLLDNGDIIIGGSNSGGRALRFNGTSWIQAGTVTSRWGGTQVKLANNHIVEIGGWGNAKAIDVFLPAANSWSSFTSLYGHTFSQCVLLDNGKVLLAAGNNGGNSELLVPSTIEKPATVTLGITSPYGSPTPFDISAYTIGATVTCTMANASFTFEGRTYTCTGFSGAGSAPSGPGNTVTFAINANSTLTWNWTVTGGTYKLVIASDHGTPSPAIGTNTIASGTTINASVEEIIDTAQGIRYLCTGFIGTGSAPQSGDTFTATFHLLSNSTLTWQWKTQYSLTTTNIHGAGAPYPPIGESWFEKGAVVNGYITSPSGDYQIAGYEGTGSLANDILPSFSIVILEPTTVDWKWMRTGENNVSLAVNSTFVAPSPSGVTVHKQGDVVNASVPSFLEVNGTRYDCTGWGGIGSVPEFGNQNTVSFTITENSVLNWEWAISYLLIIENNGDLGSPDPAVGPYWLAEGTPLTASLNSPDRGNFCTGYTVKRGAIPSGSATFVSFAMTEPTTIRWNWVPVASVDTSLTVASDYGNPVPGIGVNPYFSGAVINASIEKTVMGQPGEMFICSGWSGSGSVGFLDTNPETGLTYFKQTGSEVSITFTILGTNTSTGNPYVNTLTWNWERRYYLTVFNPAGMPKAIPSSGKSQILAHSTVLASVPPSAEMAPGIRAFCTGFTGTGSVEASGTASSISFQMDEPSSITWLWEYRYEVIIENPAGFGSPTPAAGTYFIRPGDEFSATITSTYGPYSVLGYFIETDNNVVKYTENSLTITISEPTTIRWQWDFIPTSWQQSLPITINSSEVPYYMDMERSPTTSSPIICYQDIDLKDLHLAYYSVDHWVNNKLDSFGDVGAFCNLKVDATGDTKIAYYDETNLTLKVAERIQGVWSQTVIDENAGNGRHCSINYSPGGKWAVAYLDNSDLAHPRIKYTQKFQNDWLVEIAKEFDGVIEYLSLVYYNEQPVIIFYDAASGLLKYLYYDGEWILDTIDAAPDVGRFASAAINPKTMQPAVAYYDLTNHRLKFAQRLADFTWQIQVVDETGDVGYYPNLVFDKDGKANISYQDLGKQRLRFATFDGIFWQLSTIANSPGNTTWFPALSKYLEKEFSIVYIDHGKVFYLSSKTLPDPANYDPHSGGGCFVATAAFGSLAANTVCNLTSIRDRITNSSTVGQSLVSLYYSTSPNAAEAEKRSPAFRALVRNWLSSFSR